MKRRDLLVAGGTGIASLGGYTLLTQPSEAETTISFGQFDTPDKTHFGTNPQDVILQVNAKYSYTANRPPTKWVIRLFVGTTTSSLNELTYITRTDGLESTGSGTQTLSGSLLNTPNYSQSDFQTSAGDTTQKKVWCKLIFEVWDNGEIAESVNVMTDALITVDGTSLDVSTQFGGVGGITVHDTTTS